MEQNLNNTQEIDLNKSIERAIKKYTLEVDDAIEAHGFKAASYIDYAENTISELEFSIKKQLKTHSSNILFVNLENSLNDTVKNIVNYTIEDANFRNNNCSTERIDKIEKKATDLHSALNQLNTRFLTSLEETL